MTAVYIRNPFGTDLAPPAMLPPRRRRLRSVVRRHAVPLGHPFVVSVIPPDQEVRLGAEVYAPEEWASTPIGRRDTVLITVLPRGGGGSSSGVKIAATVASLVAIIAAPWLAAAGGGALASALGTTVATAERIISGGILVGVAAANAALMRAMQQDTRPLYSVAGGGNVPRRDDRRPVVYGETWVRPPLTQPAFFEYAGEDMTLYLRGHLSEGDVDIVEARAGTVTLWRAPNGPGPGLSQISDGRWALATNTGVRSDVTSAFSGARLEFLNGTASQLVPLEVVTSPDVGGIELPFRNGPDPWTPWYRVGETGTKVNRLQVDFQFPRGYQKNDGKEIPIGVEFQFARCNSAGVPIEPPQTLQSWYGMVNTARSLRYTWTKDVPLEEYCVRGRNYVDDIPEKQRSEVQWDGLRGHIPDPAVRANRSEFALKVTSSQALIQTNFSDVTFLVRRKGLVWSGAAWVMAPLRKCVDCYIDALRDPNYGRAKADSEMPLAKAKAYREAYDEDDTFDDVINGPEEIMQVAQTLLFPFRAEPIRMGLGYDFVRDEPLAGNIRRTAFSRREIVQGTTKKWWDLDAEGTPAHFILSYNLGGDFRQVRPAEKAYGLVTRTPKRLKVAGVSRPDHAKRLATFLAAAVHFRSSGVTFETELLGRAVMRGDPIAADVWFQAGLKVRSVLDVTGTTVLLDAPLVPAPQEVVLLRDRMGRDWGPCRVTAGPTPHELVLDPADVALEAGATGLTLAQVVSDPGRDRKWTSLRLGKPVSLGTNWIVERAVPRSRLKSAISVVLDHPQVWAELGEPVDPDSPIVWGRVVSEAPAVLGISAYAVQHTSSLELEWSVAAEAGAVRILVEASYDGGQTFARVSDGAAVSGSWPMREQTEGQVLVRATAYGTSGGAGPSLSRLITTPRPIVTAIVPYNALFDDAKGLVATQGQRLTLLEERFARLAAGQAEQLAGLYEEVRQERLIMQAAYGDAMARIEEVRTVAVSATEAVAALQLTLTARLGDLSSRVDVVYAATVGPEGASAVWAVQLDVNGRVSGLKNLNTGTLSSFVVSADIFGIAHPVTGALSLAYDVGTQTLMGQNLTIIASKILSPDGRMVSDYAQGVEYYLDDVYQVAVQIGDLDFTP